MPTHLFILLVFAGLTAATSAHGQDIIMETMRGAGENPDYRPSGCSNSGGVKHIKAYRVAGQSEISQSGGYIIPSEVRKALIHAEIKSVGGRDVSGLSNYELLDFVPDEIINRLVKQKKIKTYDYSRDANQAEARETGGSSLFSEGLAGINGKVSDDVLTKELTALGCQDVKIYVCPRTPNNYDAGRTVVQSSNCGTLARDLTCPSGTQAKSFAHPEYQFTLYKVCVADQTTSPTTVPQFNLGRGTK